MQSDKLLHGFSKVARGMAETTEALAIIFEELALLTSDKGVDSNPQAVALEPSADKLVEIRTDREPTQKIVTPVSPPQSKPLIEETIEAPKPKRGRRTKAQIALEKADKMTSNAEDGSDNENGSEVGDSISVDRNYEPTVDEIREQIKTAIAKYGEEVKGRVRSALEDLGHANMTSLDNAGAEAKLAFVKQLNQITSDLAAKA